MDLVALTICPYLLGFGVGKLTSLSFNSWYLKLKTPKWVPLPKLHKYIWAVFYLCMGFASSMVYQNQYILKDSTNTALIVYFASLLFHLIWFPIISSRQFLLSLGIMQLVTITAVATGFLFFKVNPIAGYLLIPYCFFMVLRTTVCYWIWKYGSVQLEINQKII